MYPGQHVDLLVLFVQQILQILDFCFQGSHTLLERLGVTTRESPAAQFIARSTFETDVGALCTAGTNAIAADFLASASVTGLGDSTGGTGATDLDYFHGQDTRHCVWTDGHIGRRGRVVGWCSYKCCDMMNVGGDSNSTVEQDE
jgi:hypothetical protein